MLRPDHVSHKSSCSLAAGEASRAHDASARAAPYPDSIGVRQKERFSDSGQSRDQWPLADADRLIADSATGQAMHSIVGFRLHDRLDPKLPLWRISYSSSRN